MQILRLYGEIKLFCRGLRLVCGDNPEDRKRLILWMAMVYARCYY